MAPFDIHEIFEDIAKYSNFDLLILISILLYRLINKILDKSFEYAKGETRIVFHGNPKDKSFSATDEN